MAITTADYAVQVELASVTNIAKDSILNTFAVRSMSGGAAFADVTARVQVFYTALATIFGPTLNGTTNAHKVRMYHLVEPEPRPPVYVGSFSRGGSGSPLPAEVSLCTSYSAESPAGTRPARRRGRLYIGPLNTLTSVNINGYARPELSVRTTVMNATKALVEGLASDDWEFCVWSRADDSLFPVVRGWVNNEFDTQRRRGPEATERNTWAL